MAGLIVEGMPTRGRSRALSEFRGCPPEGITDHDHVTEGFPPLGEGLNPRAGKDTRRLIW